MRAYAVFGSKLDQSRFALKGSGRISGEGFCVEVISEAKGWMGSWLLERSSCFTAVNQVPLKILKFMSPLL